MSEVYVEKGLKQLRKIWRKQKYEEKLFFGNTVTAKQMRRNMRNQIVKS